MSQSFTTTDLLRLQVQEDWPDLPNLILNSVGTEGVWGWNSSEGLTLQAGITVTRVSGVTNTVASDRIEIPLVTADGVIKAKAFWNLDGVTGDASLSGWIDAYAADDTLIGSGTSSFAQTTPGSYTASYNLFTGTKYIVLRLAMGGSTVGSTMTFSDVVLYSGTTAAVDASSPLTEPDWIDVLGSAYNLTLERRELDLGTLTAHLRDADLDPAANPLIRPGKRWRLQVLRSGTWRNLSTGPLSAPLTKYDLKDPDLPDDRRTDIAMTGTDNASVLAGAPRPDGVATLDELPVVLAATGVPFQISDNTLAIDPTTAVIVSRNDSASALDQVALTRDSTFSTAYINNDGWLRAYGPDEYTNRTGPALPNGTFDTDTNGWVALVNCTLARITSTTQSGAGALRLTATADGNMTAATTTGTGGLPVYPGLTYRASAWCRRGTATSRNARITLRWYDAAGVALSSTAGTSSLNTTTWEQRTVTGTAPEGAAYLAVGLDVLSALATELHYFDSVNVDGGPTAVLDETAYTDLTMDFDLDRCINTVKPKLLRLNPTTGEPEEISFGSYQDPDSVRQWGPRVSEPTLHGIAESAIPAWAEAILAANAEPRRRVTQVQVTLRTAAEVAAWAETDLYAFLGVSNDRAAYSEAQHVVGIKHDISPDKWVITFTFAAAGTVATPQLTPPLTISGPTVAGLLRPVGEISMFGNSTLPAGWLPCTGGTFSSTDYPALAAYLGDTHGVHSGSTYHLPNFTDRFPIGTGTKSVGTSGGNATKVLTAANLPPFDSSNAAGTTTTRVARGGTSAGNVSVGSSTPVDILNPWRAITFAIRAI